MMPMKGQEPFSIPKRNLVRALKWVEPSKLLNIQENGIDEFALRHFSEISAFSLMDTQRGETLSNLQNTIHALWSIRKYRILVTTIHTTEDVGRRMYIVWNSGNRRRRRSGRMLRSKILKWEMKQIPKLNEKPSSIVKGWTVS